jgi:hypothetical protein
MMAHGACLIVILRLESIKEIDMTKPRKRTRRGIQYETLAEGYKIMKSPLAETYEATAEQFEQTDQTVGEGQKATEPQPPKEDG